MIASLRGTVLSRGLDHVVVEVGGVGMLVHTTPAVAGAAREGQETTLATTLVVREDSLTLYGFADADEKELFELVQTVSGVGPRLALAMLAVHAPQPLAAAIAQEQIGVLTKVPGIGKKGAERIVLELKDKVLAYASGDDTPEELPVAEPADAVHQQVADALVGLGWSAKQAADAVARVAEQPDAPSDVAALLRATLRDLGR